MEAKVTSKEISPADSIELGVSSHHELMPIAGHGATMMAGGTDVESPKSKAEDVDLESPIKGDDDEARLVKAGPKLTTQEELDLSATSALIHLSIHAASALQSETMSITLKAIDLKNVSLDSLAFYGMSADQGPGIPLSKEVAYKVLVGGNQNLSSIAFQVDGMVCAGQLLSDATFTTECFMDSTVCKNYAYWWSSGAIRFNDSVDTDMWATYDWWSQSDSNTFTGVASGSGFGFGIGAPSFDTSDGSTTGSDGSTDATLGAASPLPDGNSTDLNVTVNAPADGNATDSSQTDGNLTVPLAKREATAPPGEEDYPGSVLVKPPYNSPYLQTIFLLSSDPYTFPLSGSTNASGITVSGLNTTYYFESYNGIPLSFRKEWNWTDGEENILDDRQQVLAPTRVYKSTLNRMPQDTWKGTCNQKIDLCRNVVIKNGRVASRDACSMVTLIHTRQVVKNNSFSFRPESVVGIGELWRSDVTLSNVMSRMSTSPESFGLSAQKDLIDYELSNTTVSAEKLIHRSLGRIGLAWAVGGMQWEYVVGDASEILGATQDMYDRYIKNITVEVTKNHPQSAIAIDAILTGILLGWLVLGVGAIVRGMGLENRAKVMKRRMKWDPVVKYMHLVKVEGAGDFAGAPAAEPGPSPKNES
ncbi:hypothetical protein HDU97_004702 [Phlyctochytrium planicorne]|nr:hypothetical protein HDU97_004702 [Phlyctochytrium planicorne]